MEGGEGTSLEFTPTWVVAVVCSVIVFISLVVERSLHHLGKYLKRKNNKPLFEALQKVKEELMLMGFISLLLTVFQGAIQNLCIPANWTVHMLPCKQESAAPAAGHFQSSAAFFPGVVGGVRRHLAAAAAAGSGNCAKKGKVPLLSLGAIHDIHIFIFVLAVVHVVFCATTMVLAGARIRQWKRWEDEIQTEKEINSEAAPMFTPVSQNEFIRKRFTGFGNDSAVLSWVHSFIKQFFGSITRSDYATMRLGFIMTHCRGNPKLNFYKYMVRALEADFKKVVGISWYLWAFVMIFLLLNVDGWETYFWISFIPLVLLLAVGAKLEHVITRLAHDVAEKHSAIEGDLVVKPSDDHFWFARPRLVLYLIHLILFQNAFEIAYFFFVLTRHGFRSCMMGRADLVVVRLVIGGVIQLLCSYSTLPLYAIVTQMGSSFKKAIFDEHVQHGLVDWAHKVKRNVRKGRRPDHGDQSRPSRQGSPRGPGRDDRMETVEL